MRVLIVKTSSLGDLIHAFPALTDAAAAHPGMEFHWLVEEAFAAVPAWHPAVERVLPIALRRWRRSPWKSLRSGEPAHLRRQLKAGGYDLVIDAQGLLKSALPACLAGATVAGYDRRSIREPLAASFYHRRLAVSRELHAIERIRRLFALALGYDLPGTAPDYGLARPTEERERTLLFLHGTTWPSKHWPEAYWIELARLAREAGYRVEWPWHGDAERRRAERLCGESGAGELLPALDLDGLKARLARAAGVVGVDSGLAHVAAALGTPAVTLYGPTRTGLTGAVGPRQRNLESDLDCAPCLKRQCPRPGRGRVEPACFEALAPERAWKALQAQMEGCP